MKTAYLSQEKKTSRLQSLLLDYLQRLLVDYESENLSLFFVINVFLPKTSACRDQHGSLIASFKTEMMQLNLDNEAVSDYNIIESVSPQRNEGTP